MTRDLAAPVDQRVPRERAIAAIVRLLDTTLMRVGNDEFARSNGSFGLTTLRNRPAQVEGSELHLRFRGKSGVVHEVALQDRRVAPVVRRCQALPGQELVQYLEASGGDFSAKDFRT